MEGIAELFQEYSEPDEFHVQVQLELFAWARRQRHLERSRRYAERLKQDAEKLEARRVWRREYERRTRPRTPRVLAAHVSEQRRAYKRQWMANKRQQAAA